MELTKGLSSESVSVESLKELPKQQDQELESVDLFRRSLDSIMEEHFAKIDQSLLLLLQAEEPNKK